ncbi:MULTISPECIES: penicillin-binding protein 2 [Acidiphilium]|jgi:penicillin-binding protein 2|nr:MULTISPECIES: penicillin-binding protein 2 [Acidiphilium]EGO96210.1 Peptidoglycan glycosyltransferase [Acidiphilium sp. PM]KDM67547.1 penicillin-binding protein 2 [Acidiphilium sp. JA12-A1]GAN74831.1 cell division/elongation transpeptidase FtsI/penicillin-binding protein [Acidiphilium multivorum AIU301]
MNAQRDKKQRAVFTRRAMIIGGSQVALFSALTARLYEMEIVDHSRYSRLARKNAVSERLIAPERGLITDRNGVILAGNRQQWQALFLMTAASDPAATIARLERIVSLSPADRARLAKLATGPIHFLPILVKKDLGWDEMARLEVHRPSLPGLIIDRGFRRFYPLGPLTAHPVGYVVRPDSADAGREPVLALPGVRVGGSGIEKSANAALFGSPGIVEDEVDAGGAVVRVITRRPAREGHAVGLTLDAGLQRTAAGALNGRPGAAVLIDTSTGDLLAMASAPSFDPTWFDDGVPDHVWRRWTSKAAHHPLTDRATGGLYAPGSSFKPTVALAALEAGAITGDTRFFCSGHMKIGNRIFYCWLRSGHGSMDVASALQQSCDIFFYHVAMRTGIDRMAAMARHLGLTGREALALPNVAEGFIPTRRWAKQRQIDWTKGDTAVQGIGQGYTVLTPLALAVMAARIGTGRAVRPRIIRTVGAVERTHPAATTLSLSDRHLALVRQGMAEVVNTPLGTAWGARLALRGARMAGKTGTAQVIGESAEMEAENYNDAELPWQDRPNALFVGYAPLDRPRFAAAVVIEHGTLLGPVKIARDLFAAALSRRRLAYGDESRPA